MENLPKRKEKIGSTALKDCVLKLRHQNLITEAEKDAIIIVEENVQSRLFDLLMEKDTKSAIQVLEMLRNEVVILSKSSGKAFCFEHLETLNALKISVIIHCIFTYLPLADIKRCRFVCHAWDYEAEPFLRKLSQISIGTKYSNENFREAFEFSQTVKDFHALRLRNSWIAWKESTVREVISDWTALKELKMINIQIVDDPVPKTSLDMSSLLSHVHLTKVYVASLKRPLKFSIKNFLHVKDLRLKLCDLVITEGDRLSANHLEIIFCRFIFQNGRKSLNSFINFETVKTVIYRGMPDTQKIELDAGGSGQIVFDHIELRHVTILNWNTSNWIVCELRFVQVDFAGVSQNVPELDVHRSRIPFCDLPKMLARHNTNGNLLGFTITGYNEGSKDLFWGDM